MKKLRVHTFHTRVLLPASVRDEAIKLEEAEKVEKILIWQDAFRSDHHFKKGDEVYHVDNLETKMYVDRIIRSFHKNPKDDTKKSKIEGVQCHWMETILVNFE